ncbi:MAG: hypothetical protein RL076_329, partial [Chloroflexota bacterium]
QGQSFRQNPELLRLRERELMVEMMKNGNIWFVDPNTNLTLLLDNLAASNPAVTQQIIRETGVITTTP